MVLNSRSVRGRVGFNFGDSVWGVIGLLFFLGFIAAGFAWTTGNSGAGVVAAIFIGLGVIVLIVVIAIAANDSNGSGY